MANNRKSVKRDQPAAKMGSYNVSQGNFWDIKNYTVCTHRINETYDLNELLISMFKERIQIEQKYSDRLGQWHQKWSKKLEESPLYGTMKTATLGTLKEANDIAKIHQDVFIKIENQVIQKIKNHLETNYHKGIMGIKETKQYDDQFASAQKQWAAAYNKVQKAKKNYHSACKHKETAVQQLNIAKKDSEVTAEKIKKLEEAIRKCENNVNNMKKKYEEKLSRIGPLNSSYEKEMRNVYDKWAKDEEKRKDFMQRLLVDYHKCVNIHEDSRLKECFDSQVNAAYSGKTQYDVKWWSENFGADMPRNWPKFEELGELPEQPTPVSAIEPPHSNSPIQSASQAQTYSATVSNGAAGSVYQPTPDPESNPFMNGVDSKDGYDDDDDEWDDAPPPPVLPNGGIPVKALYDYNAVEDDELSFNAGDIVTKLTEEDEQGWCRGRLNNKEGLYPANYVEPI